MNINTRKICQFCRYKSCLAIGMKPKWVLSDDERHQKYGNRRKNKNIRPDEKTTSIPPVSSNPSTTCMSEPSPRSSSQIEIMPQSSNKRSNEYPEFYNTQVKSEASSNNLTESCDSDEESVSNLPACSEPAHTQDDIKRLGVDGIKTTRDRHNNYLILNAYEKDLIDRLSVAFYHSRKYNAIDLNVQKKLATLFQTADPGSLKKMSKVILANFIVQPVKRVITFAKLVPDFLKVTSINFFLFKKRL